VTICTPGFIGRGYLLKAPSRARAALLMHWRVMAAASSRMAPWFRACVACPALPSPTTLTLPAACDGHPFEYVPINYHARLGESKIRARHAYDFTLLILRIIVVFNPLKVFIPVGAVLAAAGLAKFGYDMTRNNLSESAVLGLIGALVVWAVGLLADQNMRFAGRR